MHHQTLDDVYLAVEEECRVCSMLLRHLQEHNPDLKRVKITRPFQYGIHESGTVKRFLSIYNHSDIDGSEFSCWFQIFCLYEGNGDLQSPVGVPLKTEKAVATTTSNEATMSTAQKWLEECRDRHPSCHWENEDDWLPKRLLCLEDDRVRLIITANERPKGPYVALSHCWYAKFL
jgi:hypothetical protein